MTKLNPSGNLAELVGVILGDGCLTQVSRTERLLISLDSRERDQVRYVADLMESVLSMAPTIEKQAGKNCNRVYVYKNGLSQALGLPLGNKIRNNVGIPGWIKRNKLHLRRCLKGLFETDGSCYGQPHNYTFVLDFTNRCAQLLEDVHEGLVQLGYRPQKHGDYVRLAKKAEAQKFIRSIRFKEFNCPVV